MNIAPIAPIRIQPMPATGTNGGIVPPWLTVKAQLTPPTK